MATVLSTNFDGDTTGALPAGWSAISGTWAVNASTNPVSGKSLANTSNSGSNVVVYSGATARAYQKLTFQSKYNGGGSRYAPFFIGLRMGSNGGSGYLLAAEPSGTAGTYNTVLYRINGVGAYGVIAGGAQLVVGESSTDIVNFEAIANGTALELRVWKQGASRPTTGASWTNSDFATGHFGFYSNGTGESIDVLLYEDDAAATPPSTATLTGPTSGTTGAASSVFTVTLDQPATAAVTITPAGTVGTVTFSPASPSIGIGSSSVTFTATPASDGAHAISITTSPTLTISGSPITYTTGPAGATAVTLTGPSSGTVGAASSAFTVGANGAITGSITVTPSAGGGGGTFSPTSVTISSGTPTATFTYMPASAGAKTISVTNSGGLTNPSSIAFTANAGAATAVTLTGPTSGAVGTASTAFTVGANGTISGTVTVTPSDGGGGGSFSPTTVAISAGTPTGTFTYTPGTAGAKTISVSNNGSLTNPSTITYTASSGPVTVTPDNAALYFSPGNWLSNGGGAMQANNIKAGSTTATTGNRGAYLKFRATVGASGSIKLNIDGTPLAGLASASAAPNLIWSVGGGALQTVLLASSTTQVTLASGLVAGTYEVWVAHRSVWITQDGNRAANYDAQTNVVRITGVEVSAGGSVSATTIRPKKLLVYGDSITEGQGAVNSGNSAASHDATLAYPVALAAALDCEYGQMGYWGQNWAFLNTSWSNYFAGASRLVGGLLTPAPDYIVLNYGENDGNPGPGVADINSTLAAICAAAPGAKVILNVPFSGRARTNLTAATLPANAYRTDMAAWQVVAGALAWTGDGVHPDARGHMNLGSMLAAAIINATAGAAGTTARTVTVTLLEENESTPAANLSGLKVTFRPTRDAAAEYTSSTGTTNASGVLSFTVNTTLGSGAAGFLTVDNADGTTTQSTFRVLVGWVAVA